MCVGCVGALNRREGRRKSCRCDFLFYNIIPIARLTVGVRENVGDVSKYLLELISRFGDLIANDHAWEEHVVDQNEFPWIQTRGQFADHIEDVIHDPAAIKSLSGGRTSYFDNVSGTIVIHNPGAVDLGTAFIPTGSPISYFNRGLR